jgi:endonuclease YncB( thermonuclease family)
VREWKQDLIAAVVSLSVLVAVCVYLEGADAPKPAITLPCKIVHVTDGDTLTVEVRMRVNTRLLSCWSPELREPKGPAARDHLTALAAGRDGTLEIPLDRADNLADVLTLGRVLGRVWIDGKDVGAVMVSEGLATKTKQK